MNYELRIMNWGNCLNLDLWDGLDFLDFEVVNWFGYS